MIEGQYYCILAFTTAAYLCFGILPAGIVRV
jgi:hypothetical protein